MLKCVLTLHLICVMSIHIFIMNTYTLLRQAIGHGGTIHLNIESKRVHREPLDSTIVDESRRILEGQIR